MKPIAIAVLCVSMVGCGERAEAPPVPLVPVAPQAAVAAPPAAPVVSIDPESTTGSPSLQGQVDDIRKSGGHALVFNAGVGAIKIVATAKNAPRGAIQILQFALFDAKANRLCSDVHGYTSADKTVTLSCMIKKAQPLILRIELSEGTFDYTIALEGPVTLPASEGGRSGAL
jgi:hypothetical protein